MIDQLLNARLKTCITNVYPSVAPTAYALPCAVYQLLETQVTTDLDGSVGDEGFVTFQISISSESYGQAKILARAIRNSLIIWKENGVETVEWLDEHMMADTTTQATLHRALLFFKFYTTV